MVTMRVELEGIPQTKETLEILRQITQDLKRAYESIGEYLLHVIVVEAFESEGAIYGKRWTPLDPDYSLWKSTRYPGRGILEATGKGRRGYKALSTRDYLEIVNGIKYMSDHQNGRGVPQRIIVELRKRQRDKVKELLNQNIMRRIQFALPK